MKTIHLLIICFLIAVQSVFGQTEFNQEDLINAAEYSKNMGGAAVLVMQNENIIFENYHNGADSNTATHIYSATKAFWSAIAALALQNGLITSYDEFVSNTITEWQDANLHPGKKYIKIRHLLSLSSGLSQDLEQIQDTGALATADIYQYVVDSLRLLAAPGTFFLYGPSHYYVFAVLLQRKLHNSGIILNPLQYLENEIFSKIGLIYQSWDYDSVGNPHIPNGCYLTPKNWVKFGLFILQKGRWDTTQIIDSTLTENMFVADGPNPGHGKFCWINAIDGYGVTTQMAAPPGSPGGFMYYNGFNDIIGALGAGKNRMYMIPSLSAVVLRQTLAEDDNFDDNTFLSLLLDNITSVESFNEVLPAEFILNQNYPNPFNPTTKISWKSPVSSWQTIRIYDLLGNEIATLIDEYKPTGNYSIDFNTVETLHATSLPSGVYFYRLQVGNYVQSKKMILLK